MAPGKGRVAALKKEVAAPLTPQRKALADKNAQLETEVEKLTKLLDAAALNAKTTLDKLDEKENANKALTAKVQKLQKIQAFKPDLPVNPKSTDGGSKKEKKDPRQPQRPASAFVLWSKDHRQQVQNENPGASFGALSTLMGEKWRTVSADEKKPYEAKAEALKKPYAADLKKYKEMVEEEKKEADALAAYKLQQMGQAQEELWKQFEAYQKEVQETLGGKKEKKEKDADKPKRPLTSFLAFANERRPLIHKQAGDQKLSVPEVGRQLGAEWNKLSDKQKAKYEKMVESDTARYKAEMEAYKARKEQEEQAAKKAEEERSAEEKVEALKLYDQQERERAALRLLKQKEEAESAQLNLANKEKRESKKRDPNKPKRPMSGYLLFGNEARNEVTAAHPEATFGQLTALIAAKWKALTPQEQEAYNQKALPLWQRYEREMEAYNRSLVLYVFGDGERFTISIFEWGLGPCSFDNGNVSLRPLIVSRVSVCAKGRHLVMADSGLHLRNRRVEGGRTATSESNADDPVGKSRSIVDHSKGGLPKATKVALLFLVSIAPAAYLFSSLNISLADKRFILGNLGFSVVGFLLTVRLIPIALPYMLRKGMYGMDINKRGSPGGEIKVPESQGLVAGVVFLVCTIIFQHFYFSADSQWLVEYNAALASICFMIFLGFIDDVLDIPWRVKLLLPTVAALPLLMAYAGGTSIVVPKPLRGLFKPYAGGDHLELGPYALPVPDALRPYLSPYLSSYVIELGWLYKLYMGLLAVFCTNSINIYAGVNGLEAGQTVVIAASILAYNMSVLGGIGVGWPLADEKREAQLFSLYLMQPFLAVTLGILSFNWYPSSVFVGDTFTYFAGMTFAVVGILGHFSEMLLLFFIPQILNFLYSCPQLFKIVPCPRHRLPKFDPAIGLLTGSNDLNLVNLFLRIFGPLTEQQLCIRLLVFQGLCSAVAFAIRYLLTGVYK